MSDSLADLLDLLDAVYANPDDDEPRRIYADALLERGDPRGELIALQLDAERRRGVVRIADAERARELVAKHAKTWLGPLADFVEHDPTLVFRRGFLDGCVVAHLEHDAIMATVANPIWRTLRVLDTHDMELATHPALVSLRCAGLTPAALSALARRATPVALEAATGIGVKRDSLEHDAGRDRWYPVREQYGLPLQPRDDWAAALAVGALVHLTSLQLAAERPGELAPAELGWLLDSPLSAQLRELEIFEPRTDDPRTWDDRGRVERSARWVIALAERRRTLCVHLRSGWPLTTRIATAGSRYSDARIERDARGGFTISGAVVALTSILALVREARPAWRIQGIRLDARWPRHGFERSIGRFSITA